FPAVEIDSVPYVDGGLCNNLPVEPFRNQRKNVVNIHVNPIRDLGTKRGLWETVERAFHLSFAEMVRQSAEGCYMYIEPKELMNYNLFDLNKSNEIIEIGYQYGLNYLSANPQLLKNETFFEKVGS